MQPIIGMIPRLQTQHPRKRRLHAVGACGRPFGLALSLQASVMGSWRFRKRGEAIWMFLAARAVPVVAIMLWKTNIIS